MTPVNCKQCAIPPSVECDGWMWSAVCHNCYDADCVGDPPRFVSRSIHATSNTRDGAIESWNERVEESD